MPRSIAHLRRSLAARRRAALWAWAELVERGATEGPRALRPLFEAELAFEQWAAAAWRRVRPHLLAFLAWLVAEFERTRAVAGPRLRSDA
ncbi:MAG: hypothetical protein M3394_08840, partial [Actinomycetota bacterium]|nr:hypothetical protein [Actinomycetota bacterium]